MKILTPDNRSCDTVTIPDQDCELHYCVLDYSNLNDIDYQFLPMVFIEDFAKAAVELKIGESIIQVPLEWSVLIGDTEYGEIELLPIQEFHGRDFSAFVFNPISGYMPQYFPIEITNIYQEVRWTVPTLKPNQLLAVGLNTGTNPNCVYFASKKTKFPEMIELRDLF